MKRNTGWMVLVLATLAVGVGGCPRTPECDGSCASGATRCKDGRAESCQAGCWHRSDPIRATCAPGLACCLTAAPYDAGMIFACARSRRCVGAELDGGAVASFGDGGVR